MDACGVLTAATGTNEIILEIIPLITQLSDFEIEITKSSGGTVIIDDVPLNFGVIRYTVPAECYSAAGTMRVRLLSAQGNSGYVDFVVSENIAATDNIKIKFDSNDISFSIAAITSASDTGWINLVLTDNTYVKYRVKNGWVSVIGLNTGDASNALPDSSYKTIATIPIEFRPTYRIPFTFHCIGGGHAKISAYIETSGKINLYIADGATAYWGFNVSYPL